MKLYFETHTYVCNIGNIGNKVPRQQNRLYSNGQRGIIP